MKITLSPTEIAERLLADEYASWTRAGARALAEYLTRLDMDLGIETEFDPLAIRCEWNEYSSAVEAAENYGWDASEYDAEDAEEVAFEYLSKALRVIGFDGGVITADS